MFQYHDSWRDQNRTAFLAARDEYCALTRLTSVLSTPAGLLSGGQKRKLEIVRALLAHPAIIICDEPFAGVDPKSISEIGELFVTLSQERGIGFFISDHNIEQLISISSYLSVLIGGKLITAGTRDEILHNAYTREHYFGSQFHELLQTRFTTSHS